MVAQKSPTSNSVDELFNRREDAKKFGKRLVPDVEFFGCGGSHATDVSVVYAGAASYLPRAEKMTKAMNKGVGAMVGAIVKAAKARVNARAREKSQKYSEACTAEHIEFVPFVAESHGYLHESAVNLLDKLVVNARLKFNVEVGELKGYLQRRLAIALQRGNALLEREGRIRSRGSYGAAVSAGLIVPVRR